MTIASFTILPDLFKFDHPDINVTQCHSENDIQEAFSKLLKSVKQNVVGLAPIYGKKCRLTSLAIASDTDILIIMMSTAMQPIHYTKKKPSPQSRRLLRNFLCDSTISKYAFRMDKLAAALFFDYNLPLACGKDILSVTTKERHSIDAIFSSLGGEVILNVPAVRRLFLHEETDVNQPKTLALQAWAAYFSACLPDMVLLHKAAHAIDTDTLRKHARQMLDLVTQTVRNSSLRVMLKPTRIANDVQAEFSSKTGKLIVKSQRYKTRVMRPSGNQVINIVTAQANGSLQTYRGRALKITGKTSVFEVRGNLATTPVQAMETVGRESLTCAEVLKEGYMLDILQGKIDLSIYPFVSALWNIPKNAKKKKETTLTRPLNRSQKQAVSKILSDNNADRVVLIHGPPGTGKTTVIAASVTSIIASPNKKATVWLVAQSNVAVKNMAEKLASIGFLDFKILVSMGFHFEWHEHLYEKIELNLIRSDEFVNDIAATERQLLGSRVIMCTLSTLSNDKISAIARLAPLQTVIFDEASQIETSDYFPMLLRFHPTISKLVFIGDNKQLAPHGASEIDSLDSIFEKSHLLARAVFLDTQYRMPTPIGRFISTHVYDGRLKSQHAITDSRSCRFVDVNDGFEESKGHSWQNTREVDVAIAIARHLETSKCSFRIITPYDPQRSLLENGLKQAGLSWKDKCFNIDAFQGNEDDYIIISLVRTQKLGFLINQRRVNVMLTRCKKGLIICANRQFLEGPGSTSLVAKLMQFVHKSSWVMGREVLYEGLRPFL